MRYYREITEAKKPSTKKVDKLFTDLLAELRALGLATSEINQEFAYYLKDSVGYSVQQARNEFDNLKGKYKI